MEQLPIFRTNRLILRPWKLSDAEQLYKLASNPSVGPAAGWNPHQSVDESLEVIRAVFREHHMWAMTLKDSGDLIGCVGYLKDPDSNIKIGPRDGEVGYWVGEQFWGQGYASEALRSVVRYAFVKGKILNLWGCFFDGNKRSEGVMENCGFANTGEVTFCPSLEFGGDQPVKKMGLSRRAWIKYLFT